MSDLLQRLETLTNGIRTLGDEAENEEQKERADYTYTCLESLEKAITDKAPVFGIEPWHAIHDDVPLSHPGEFLLRLNDAKGEALPPYPAIMTFYENGFTADIDTVLVLCALEQFQRSDEKQVSVNVSARSLRDANFIKTILSQIELMSFADDEQIIIEIHESTPSAVMSPDVLSLFRKCGVMFAIDDVGLHMNDVLRLSEFEDIADFIKLDRKSVCAHPEEPNSLQKVMAFILSMLPNAVVVAEGVKTAEHAAQVHSDYPDVKYVQGLYLPDRDTFAAEWAALSGKKAAIAGS